MPTAAGLWDRAKLGYDQLTVLGNRKPYLTIRQVLWFFTGGVWLALLYVLAALVLASTLIFLPFSLQALRIALFALDGGITLEPAAPRLAMNLDFNPMRAWDDPTSPYTIAANVAWAVVFGWSMVLAHMSAALVQALTIIGLGTAVVNIQLASFVIWPFGRTIKRRALPTTLEELQALREASAMETSAAAIQRPFV